MYIGFWLYLRFHLIWSPVIADDTGLFPSFWCEQSCGMGAACSYPHALLGPDAACS